MSPCRVLPKIRTIHRQQASSTSSKALVQHSVLTPKTMNQSKIWMALSNYAVMHRKVETYHFLLVQHTGRDDRPWQEQKCLVALPDHQDSQSRWYSKPIQEPQRQASAVQGGILPKIHSIFEPQRYYAQKRSRLLYCPSEQAMALHGILLGLRIATYSN